MPEHIKYAGPRITEAITLLINLSIVHGFLPEKLLDSTLVPVVKDKCGRLSTKDNYRPIALCNVITKILEVLMLDRMMLYLYTNDNQFGFKTGHCTDMAIFAIKEIINYYKEKNSTMFVCFLDASKAFDRINHGILFMKLKKRGLPETWLRLLKYWYSNQKCYIRWGSMLSEPFSVSNGVRQGGILSPFLFNVYMDDLSDTLNMCSAGAYAGHFSNHLMYADDIVLYAPSVKGLQRLINTCDDYGKHNDILYNSKKSCVLIAKCMNDQHVNHPPFYLGSTNIPTKNCVKYLGHIIRDDIHADDDIKRQRKSVFLKANLIKRRFLSCSWNVKIVLFKSYCTQFYTCSMWNSHKLTSYHSFVTAYNQSLRYLLNIPSYCSAKQMFAFLSVPSANEILRHSIYRTMTCFKSSHNNIVNSIFTSDAWRLSKTRKFWYNRLYSMYMSSG